MTSNESTAPLLSICLAGRDDDYMIDFLYRASTTINYYARCVEKLRAKVTVEIVFTDWGSDRPLSQTLELSAAACAITRFIFVSKDTIRRTQEVADQFHTTRSLNTSILHSKGTFVFLTNADQLMPQTALQNLVDLLNGDLPIEIHAAETLMVVPRIQIPWQFLQRQPSLEEWERFMFFNEYTLVHQPEPPESYIFGSTGGFVVLRQLACHLGGLNEKQSGWGWSDIDFCFRTTQEHDFIYLSNLGIHVFHMGHAPFGRRTVISTTQELKWSDEVEANEGHWGLSGSGVEEQRSLGNRDANVSGAGLDSLYARMASAVKSIDKELCSKNTLVHVYKAISLVSGEDWKIDDPRVAALSLLAWYGLNFYPRRYLELGIMEADAYGVIAATCPSVEICAAEHPMGHISNYLITSILKKVCEMGLQTHFHLLTANYIESLRRLEKMTVTFPDFDLAYLRIETIGGNMREGALLAWDRIAQGGALVVGNNGTGQRGLWTEMAQVFFNEAQVVVRSRDHTAALIIKGPRGCGSRSIEDIGAMEFDPGRMNPQRLRRLIGYYPSAKKRFARRIWRKIKVVVEKTAERL